MLYVIQHGLNGVRRVELEYIVSCVVKLENLIINDVDCIFTDGQGNVELHEGNSGRRYYYVDGCFGI